MKTERSLLTVVFLFCLWQLNGQAGFLITPADSSDISSEPGNLITRAYFVTETGSGEGVFDFDVELPDDWRLVSGKERLEIGAGEKDMTLVSFYIPESTPAGEYEFEYQCISTTSKKILEYYLINVIVEPQRDFSIELLEYPTYCVAGDTYRLSYQLKNKGNVESEYLIKGISQDQLIYNIDRRSITLKAKESATIRTYVETDPFTLYTVKHLFQLQVLPDEDETRQEEIGSLVEILPRITGKEEPYNTFPLELTVEPLFEHGETDNFGVKAQVSGEGAIDPQGETNLSIFMKRPFNQESQLTPDREEFRLGMWTDKWDLFMGDGFFSLSPLTETSKFARGINGSIEIEDFDIQAFYLMEKESSPLFEETAASITYSPQLESTYSLNYLNKGDWETYDLFSLEGHLHPRPKDLFDFEYASGGGLIQDDSYYFSLGGSHEQLSYRLKYLYAGPDFQGVYEDLSILNSNLTYLINEKISVSAVYGYTENFLYRDFPSVKEYVQTRLTWRINRDTNLLFYWTSLDHDDKLPEPLNRFEQENLGMTFTRSLGLMKFNASVDLGTIDNQIVSRTFLLEKFGLSMNTEIAGKHNLFASLAYNRDEKDSYEKVFYSLDLKWKFKLLPTTDIYANYRTVNYLSSYYSGSDGLDLGFNHVFNNQSKLNFNGRYSPARTSENKTAFSISLLYSMPLDIPISKKQNMVKLEGKVQYLRTEEPLSNVILRIGSAVAVSDAYGRFVFHSLSPGIYKIFLDSSSLEENLITADSFPMDIILERKETNVLDVNVVESSSIKGQLSVYDLKPTFGAYSGGSAQYKDPYGLANTIVQFRKGNEVYRTVTDSQGRFFMSRLRPGEWQITIDESVLQENHYLEEREPIVDLGIEEDETVEIKILSKIRPVIFIDEGVIEEVVEEVQTFEETEEEEIPEENQN